ncbi:hypothetical protein [Xanthomonas fragariae]|uniref:hypothetical protein n=1 Tax=Xanthomonas fragariae TaxID=48664 RepID=UPI001ABE413F|nr:hypothetical protein [Xanthomonas fragariae]UKR53745.1 hypothetical protein K4A87_07780 [Xanthomonas fragariae]
MEMVQIAMGSDRQVWANYLGRIIFSMNEIDWILSRIRVEVFKAELSSIWLSKTFSERLVSIAEKIKQVPGSPAMDELKRLIERTEPLNEVRNHVAHGMLGLVGAPEGAPRGASFVMIRYNKNKMHEITFNVLVERTKEAMKLGDDYSLFFAKCQLHADFIAPYARN